eukprot:s6712_g3.t1
MHPKLGSRSALQCDSRASSNAEAPPEVRGISHGSQVRLWPAVATTGNIREPPCISRRCAELFQHCTKPGRGAIPGASDQVCCEKTCSLFNCSVGYVANEAYIHNTGFTDTQCCDRACGAAESEGAFKCNESQAVGNPLKAGTSPAECCEDICELHKCGPLWVPNPEATLLPGNTDEKCCLPTCGQVRCDPGYIYDELMIEKPGTTKEQCCVKSCELFKCDAAHGFSIPEKKKSQKATSADDCCEPQCRHHECGPGWLKDVSKDDQFDPSDEKCCIQQCASFQCPKGWQPDAAKKEKISSSKDVCCVPPCSLHTCDADAGMANAGDGVFGRTDARCCKETCAKQTCSPPKIAAAIRIASFPKSEDLCCEPEGCGEFRKLNKLGEGANCNSLSKDDCDSSYFAYFSKENGKNVSRWVRCVFDKDYGGLCRLETGEKEQKGCAV